MCDSVELILRLGDRVEPVRRLGAGVEAKYVGQLVVLSGGGQEPELNRHQLQQTGRPVVGRWWPAEGPRFSGSSISC